jgi:hypothetical protein
MDDGTGTSAARETEAVVCGSAMLKGRWDCPDTTPLTLYVKFRGDRVALSVAISGSEI